MKQKLQKKSKNTVEAFDNCSCYSGCWGCFSECSASNCACDTTYFNIPFADVTYDERGDNTSSIREGSGALNWTRYSK